jgi:hypothetical protein
VATAAAVAAAIASHAGKNLPVVLSATSVFSVSTVVTSSKTNHRDTEFTEDAQRVINPILAMSFVAHHQ